MSCFDGRMQEYSRVSLDRFDGKNLQSTVYFLSHLHSDHTVGLNGYLFLNRLKSNKDIFLYCSAVTKVLIEASPKYREISPYVKCLDVNTPTTVTIPDPLYEETEQITVTLLPAFHCPGSVMFLIEGNEGTVLYTGDFRWEHLDLEQMHHLRSAESTKKIKSLYVDTTFCCPENLHIPSRQQCIDAVYQIVREWTSQSPQHVVYILLKAYYGHEPLINSVASRLKQKAHVCKHKYDVYERIHELSGNFTFDGTNTQLHACDRNCTVDIDGQTLPCRDVHDAEKVLCILPTTMYFTHFQQLSLDKIVKRVRCNLFRACYSFHSSYTEVKDLLAYLKPDQAFANVKCPKDDTLNQTQHQLNVMLKECKEFGAGEATPVEIEIRELGTLKTKPGYNTRKRKGRESPSDCESLDFGSTPKKTSSESSDIESVTSAKNRRGRGRGKGRGKRTQETVSQTVVNTRRSSRLSASRSMQENEVTPKKRKTSTRSETSDLFITPEKNKKDDNEIDQQSSFLGSQRSDSELSLFSSQKSHDASLPSSYGETDWTGGSFLAAVSSNEDSQGMFCVTEDNQELDESSVDEKDVDSDVDDPNVATNQEVPENGTKDIPERTERGILHVKDDTDTKKDVLQNVPEINEGFPSESNVIDDPDDKTDQSTENDRNIDEIVDVNKDIQANNGDVDVNDDLHLHFSGSTVNEIIDKDIINEDIESTNQNKSDCSPGKESGIDGKPESGESYVNKTIDRDDEIIILDSDSSEQMTLEDYEEFIDNIKTDDETKTTMETVLDVTDHTDIEHKPITDVEEINSIVIKENTSSDGVSTHDESVLVEEQSKTNELQSDDSHPDSANSNVYKQTNDSNGVVDEHGDDGKVVRDTENDINAEVNMNEKTVNKHLDADNEDCNKTLDEDDDVVEIVDLTGEDLAVKYETQETSKMAKKTIKISLLSKNIFKKLKKTDENSKIENAITEPIDIEKTPVKSDGENKEVDKKTVVTDEPQHVKDGASEDECEYISSSPEWLSSTKATTKQSETPKNKPSNENAPDSDSEMQTESLETAVVSEEELEKRAEVKRQAMGFVCETDSESNSDSDTSPDSPTPEVLYDDYIELSSGTDDDDDPSASGSRTGGNNGSGQKSDKSSDSRRSESGNNESNSSSSGWLRSHKRRGHSDEVGEEGMENVSKRSGQRESSLSSEKAESTDDKSSNEMIWKNIKRVSVPAFKKREYRRLTSNYRSNQTPVTTKSLQSSYHVPPSVHSYQQTSYPPNYVASQSYPYQYPPNYNYGNNDHKQSALHPSVPNVSETATISLPSMTPRVSEKESHDSQSSHFRTVSISGKRKHHSLEKDEKNLPSWQQDGSKLFQRGPTGQYDEHTNTMKSHPSSLTSGTRKSRDYNRAGDQLQANLGQGFAALTNQHAMKAPEKVDIASIKANISALTGISVVNAQSTTSSVNAGNESGESLDEMVEKLKKIEQMKALLNVVSGKTPETKDISNAETEAQEVFDYAHRNSRQIDEVKEDHLRRTNYPETFREHPDGEYRREPYIQDREFRRRSSREDEDYELWLRERRHDRYPRRPPSPSWRYHEDSYHERRPRHHRRSSDYDRPVPFPHRDPEYDRHAHHRKYDYGRSPPWHRDHDPDYRRHPAYHRDTEYERPPRYWDQEYDRPLPPPRHRSLEYERAPPRHRDAEYDRPPPWHHDVDYDGPPPRFRDLEYESPTPPSHAHPPPRTHFLRDKHNKYPYRESDHRQGSGNRNSYHSDDQNTAGGGGDSVKTTSYLKLQAQLTEFKKKPIMAHVLSRSGQVLAVGQADTSLQHVQTTKSSDDVNINDNSKTDADTPVFLTGIIPANR